MEFYIEQLKIFSTDITQALNNLLSQLNPSSKSLKDEDVKEIIEDSSNSFFVAREPINNKIVGMLTLVVYRIPVWKKGWIEDLVVDKEYRGKGIATKLISEAINEARRNGVSYLYFSSNPKRVAANRLYQHLGFKKRETNLYRVEL